MLKAPRFVKSLEFILFAVVFATYAFFYPASGHNEAARFDSIRAVIDEHRLIVDTFAYNSGDLISVNGHYYSSKAPGLSLLGLPVFFALDKVTALFEMNPDFRYHLICYLTSVLVVGFFGALLSVLIFKYLKQRWAATDLQAVIVALTISLGTIIFPFATIFFSHVVTASIGFLGFWFLQRVTIQNRPGALKSILASGLCLGFIVTIEYPAAIMTVLVGFYALVRFVQVKRTRWIIPFALMGVVGVSFLPIYNSISFGDPFFLSYEAYKAQANEAFKAQSVGLFGVRYDFFNLAFVRQFIGNLSNIVLSPVRGLLYLNPILLLAPVGFFFGVRRYWRTTFRADLVLSLMMIAGFLAMNAAYGDSIVYWGGGASFGPRHLIPAIPFLAIPLFFALKQMTSRFVFAALAFISIFYCLMGAAIEPRTPYSPDNPIFELYMPKFANAQFSLEKDGVFSDKPVIDGHVAFNWGQLLHLPPGLELIPLFAIWIFAAALIEKRTLAGGSFFKAVLLFCCVLAFVSGAALFRT